MIKKYTYKKKTLIVQSPLQQGLKLKKNYESNSKCRSLIVQSPLQQGLKPPYTKVPFTLRISYRTKSITTRIETSYNFGSTNTSLNSLIVQSPLQQGLKLSRLKNISELFSKLIVQSPLQQGLKPILQHKKTKHFHTYRTKSITTRIETLSLFMN